MKYNFNDIAITDLPVTDGSKAERVEPGIKVWPTPDCPPSALMFLWESEVPDFDSLKSTTSFEKYSDTFLDHYTWKEL